MPLLMSAFTPKANIGPQSLHVRFGSKADMCAAKSHVRFPPKADIVRRRPPPLFVHNSWVDVWVSEIRLIDCQSGQ